jgi:threonine dehydrogenase-like Zn-dependent dehydrogenase
VVQCARLGDDAWTDEPPRVLVTGMGPIAFAAVVACRCRDWPVTMYGRDESSSFRAGLAESFGARYLPAGHGALIPPDVEQDGYDLVLECTGSDELMLQAAAALASRGAMSWLGSTRLPQPAPRNVARLMRDAILRNHVFIGCVNSAPRDFAAALSDLSRMLRTHPREIAALITDRVPPRDSLDHYRRRRPQGIKTVLMYE